MSKKIILTLVILSILVTSLIIFFIFHVNSGTRIEDIPTPEILFDIYNTGPTKGGIITVTYPLSKTVFPSEIIPPEILWEDSNTNADVWAIRVTVPEDRIVITSASTIVPAWRPESEEWEKIKKKSLNRDVRVEIISTNYSKPDKIISEGSVNFSTSDDACDVPIFYREVELPFSQARDNPRKVKWRFGSISSPEQPPVILENINTCGNCHSFSKDGKVLGMDLDYASDKGSYWISQVDKEIVIAQSDIISWSNYRKNENDPTFGLFSSISPDGKYVVSTVKDYSIFEPKIDIEYSQLFFPIKGILVIYNRDNRTFSALPGANDKAYVQSNPVWSPDGKEILFIRSKALDVKLDPKTKKLVNTSIKKDFIEGKRGFKFDIYRIPFNSGKGGKAEPVKGASHNGMSNYFPKFSPDGKWIVFCKAKNFCLLQPDSELFIIPAQGGMGRRLECNTSNMNSWHSWSPNNRWLVFSSKKMGPYTKLFLSHIDKEGHSTPPVLLEKFASNDRAANIPEFVPIKADAIRKIYNYYIEDKHVLRIKTIPINGKNLTDLENDFRKRISNNSNDSTLYNCLGGTLDMQGKFREAIKSFSKAHELNPDSPDICNNLGIAHKKNKDIENAIKYYKKGIKLAPESAPLWFNLGVVLTLDKQFDKAEKAYKKALSFEKNIAVIYLNLVTLLKLQNKNDEALKISKDRLNLKNK